MVSSLTKQTRKGAPWWLLPVAIVAVTSIIIFWLIVVDVLAKH